MPYLNLGNDNTLCESESLKLKASDFISTVWNNQSLADSLMVLDEGEYWVKVSDANTCINSDTINVYYHAIDSITIDSSICEGMTVFGYSQTGYYSITETSTITGCDSVIELNLRVNKIDTSLLTKAICEGDSYDFYGTSFMLNGTYHHVLSSSLGCDSIVELNLIVNELPEVWLGNDTSICERNTLLLALDGYTSYQWSDNSNTNSLSISSEGEYWVEVNDTSSCINRDTLIVSTINVDTISIDTAICLGESVMGYSETGFYTIAELASTGCDSIVLLDLMVLDIYEYEEDKTLCLGKVYTWQGNDYTESGSYFVNYNTVNGCDSVHKLTLVVNTLPVVNIGHDTKITIDDDLVLDAGPGFTSYLWSTNESTQTIDLVGEDLGIGDFNYSVWISDGNSCQNGDTIVITVEQGLGIQESTFEFKVYPNPVSDVLTIQNLGSIHEVSLYNLTGQLLQTIHPVDAGEIQISMNHLDQGSYLISITDVSGQVHVLKV